MESIKFELEIITPMFLGGADGRTAELRAPSVKGLMRFWWRAVKGLEDIKELQKEEAKIFGSSEEKYGKSKFSIKIISGNLSHDRFSPLPHSTTNRFTFKGFKPNQSFSIILISKNNINYFQNIFELTLLLGGLGKRSRRGFGNVHYKRWDFYNANNLLKYILEKLNTIKDDFEIRDNKILRKSTPSANYPFIKEIVLGKIERDYNILLKKIGQASHNHKNPSLGFAGKYNNNSIRMSSPIYVSIKKINNEFIPVITTLNASFPSIYPNYDISKQNNFIKSIIGG